MKRRGFGVFQRALRGGLELLVRWGVLRPVYRFQRPNLIPVSERLRNTGDRVLEARIAENSRNIPLVSFWACFAFAFYLAKLLYDERVRYYHYIYFPDRMFWLDEGVKALKRMRTELESRHGFPREPSLLGFYDFWRSVVRGREEARAQRRTESAQQLQAARERADAQIVEIDRAALE